MHNRHMCTIGTKKSRPIANEIFYEIVVYFNLHQYLTLAYWALIQQLIGFMRKRFFESRGEGKECILIVEIHNFVFIIGWRGP